MLRSCSASYGIDSGTSAIADVMEGNEGGMDEWNK